MDWSALVTLTHGLEQFLLPNACVSCDRPVRSGGDDRLVCSLCIARLGALRGGCLRCQQPLPLSGPCRFCTHWPAALKTVRSAVWMSDESRRMIHHLKYEGYWRVGMDLADVMAHHVQKPVVGTLLPIPLGTRRARERGYNQAACLARGLAVRWGVDVDDHTLARAAETRSQTSLTPDERARNVADVFAVTKAREEPTPAVILVDDVLTTGATLASAAGTLERAGWSEIHAVTFARVMPFEVSVGQHDPQKTVRS